MSTGDNTQPAFPIDDNDEWREERLTQMMGRALTGDLHRGRPLKYWENQKLSARHLQILMMKAAGYTNNAIAEQMELTPARVSVIVNHPMAQTVLAHLVSYQADNILDIRARIQAHAGEMLDKVVQVVRTTNNDELASKNAFKILEMAGYGEVKKIESKQTVEVESASADRLTSALNEAMSVVRNQSYQQFLQKPQDLPEADYEVTDEEPNA